MTFYIFENISIFCGIHISNMYTFHVSLEIQLASVEGVQITSDLDMGEGTGRYDNTAAKLKGDTHITRDLSMGGPKTRGYPNPCDTTTDVHQGPGTESHGQY